MTALRPIEEGVESNDPPRRDRNRFQQCPFNQLATTNARRLDDQATQVEGCRWRTIPDRMRQSETDCPTQFAKRRGRTVWGGRDAGRFLTGGYVR